MHHDLNYLQIGLAVIAIAVAFKLTASIIGLAVRLALAGLCFFMAAYWLGVLPEEQLEAIREMWYK